MSYQDEAVKEFIEALLTPIGAGTFVWLVAGWIFKSVPWAEKNWKFWLVTVLSLLVPPLAYATDLLLYGGTFSTTTLLYYIGLGFTISQLEHKGSQAIVRKVKGAVEAVKSVGKRESRSNGPDEPPAMLRATMRGDMDVVRPGVNTQPLPETPYLPLPSSPYPLHPLKDPKPIGWRPPAGDDNGG